jgi:hypothetical protein
MAQPQPVAPPMLLPTDTSITADQGEAPGSRNDNFKQGGQSGGNDFADTLKKFMSPGEGPGEMAGAGGAAAGGEAAGGAGIADLAVLAA